MYSTVLAHDRIDLEGGRGGRGEEEGETYSELLSEVPTRVPFALAWLLTFFKNVALGHQSTTDNPIQFFSSLSDC